MFILLFENAFLADLWKPKFLKEFIDMALNADIWLGKKTAYLSFVNGDGEPLFILTYHFFDISQARCFLHEQHLFHFIKDWFLQELSISNLYFSFNFL